MPLSRSEVLARLGQVAERTFNCPAVSISEATVAEDVPGWDSLSHTIFIMSVEDAFGVEFDVNSVFAFNNVGDLVTAILENGAT